MTSDYKAGSKIGAGRSSQLTAIQRVVWGSALELSGRGDGCLIIAVTRELLERIVSKSRRKAHGLSTGRPSDDLWEAVHWFCDRESGRRFMREDGAVDLSRHNRGGNPVVAVVEEPEFVYQQLRNAAGISDVECLHIHVTPDLLARCLRNLCRPWCRRLVAASGGLATDYYYAALLALYLRGRVRGSLVRVGRGSGGPVVDGWYISSANTCVALGWLRPEELSTPECLRSFMALSNEDGSDSYCNWGGVLRMVENPLGGALERRPFFTSRTAGGVATLYPFSRCKFGEKWQKHTYLLIWGGSRGGGGGCFTWDPPHLCRFDCDMCYRCESTGRLRHLENIGNDQGHSMYKKHRLPLPMVTSVLDSNGLVRAGEGEWGLNLFCGTDSILPVFAGRGYGYIGVDLFGSEYVTIRKCGRVEARLLADIGKITMGELLDRVYHICGLRREGLRFVWASPPCTTYSRMDTCNGSIHRDWSAGRQGAPLSDQAVADDILVSHLFSLMDHGPLFQWPPV